MGNLDLSIVIVTWNSAPYIVDCIRSITISAQDYRFEIILVDNNSGDNTIALVKRCFPTVRIFPQRTNLGFGQANNVGISDAIGTFILLLNPDTLVNKQAITTMYTFLEGQTEVGAVGPEQLTKKGEIIFTASRLTLRGLIEYSIEKTHQFFTGKQIIFFKAPYQVSHVNLGCVMTKRALWNQGVFFDQKLFIYGEEVDLFSKIRGLGWKVYFLRNCTIYHFREKSISMTHKKFWFAFDSYSYLLLRKIKELFRTILTR